jgi:hypothetical protein
MMKKPVFEARNKHLEVYSNDSSAVNGNSKYDEDLDDKEEAREEDDLNDVSCLDKIDDTSEKVGV